MLNKSSYKIILKHEGKGFREVALQEGQSLIGEVPLC